MKFDSQEQKTFVIECFKKYSGSKEDRLTIEQALMYINAYSEAITQGKIVIVKPVPIKKEAKQDDKDTPDNPPVGTTEGESGQEAAS